MPETNSGGAPLIGLLAVLFRIAAPAAQERPSLSRALGPLAAKGLCLPHGLTLATESIPPFYLSLMFARAGLSPETGSPSAMV